MQGYVRQRRGRYYAVIYEGLDAVTGREIRRWHPAGEDRAAAERLAKKLAETANGRADAIGSLTFGAFVVRDWLPTKKLHLAATTYAGNERNVQNHLLPALEADPAAEAHPHEDRGPPQPAPRAEPRPARGLVAVGYEIHQTRGKTRNAHRPIDLDRIYEQLAKPAAMSPGGTPGKRPEEDSLIRGKASTTLKAQVAELAFTHSLVAGVHDHRATFGLSTRRTRWSRRRAYALHKAPA
jgi:hypothetical protein